MRGKVFILIFIFVFISVLFLIFAQNKIKNLKQERENNRIINKINNSTIPEEDLLEPTGKLFYPNLEDTVIVILTYKRMNYLSQSLNSLLTLPGLKQFTLIISQDGNVIGIDKKIQEMIKSLNYRFKKVIHSQNLRNDGMMKTSEYIAAHYKYILDKIFFKLGFSKAIILEEDMIFSYDFLHYFDQTSFLLDDPSVWCISSWNDFGLYQYSRDRKRLFRTQYFPGLGWMLKKSLWNELSPKFANDLWDNWMRSPYHHKERDCIVPEISRNRNIGEEGANMNQKMFNEKLKKINFYEGKETDFGDLNYLKYENYEENLYEKVKNAKIINGDPKTLFSLKNENAENLLFIYSTKNVQAVLSMLGIPFGEMRTHHNFLVILRFGSGFLYLAHHKLTQYLPEDLRVKKTLNTLPHPSQLGMTCDRACSVIQKKCSEEDFDFINNCETLKKFFPCTDCLIQYGSDLPNYVDDKTNEYNGKCLVTFSFVSYCISQHQSVKRLCPCV